MTDNQGVERVVNGGGFVIIRDDWVEERTFIQFSLLAVVLGLSVLLYSFGSQKTPFAFMPGTGQLSW
jgi:hypothetical protein